VTAPVILLTGRTTVADISTAAAGQQDQSSLKHVSCVLYSHPSESRITGADLLLVPSVLYCTVFLLTGRGGGGAGGRVGAEIGNRFNLTDFMYNSRRAIEGRRSFQMLHSAIPTCHRGRKVALAC
jgi:hypothetical protein